MVKFLHLFKHYYLGISFIGIVAFAIQELPYLIMPFIKLETNPIMNVQNGIKWIETAQGFFGILSMIMLMLIVRDDISVFSLAASKERAFFLLTILMIVINFVGWGFYYTGHQYGALIVLSQFAVVPLYYMFFGLWKKNYLLVAATVPFFLIHTINGSLSFVCSI